MDTYFAKTTDGLVPVDEYTTDAWKQYGDGEVIRVKLFKDRNPRHHRLFFGLLNMVYANQEKYLSQEALRFAITIQAGWVDEIRLSGDRVALKPKSIAWGRMDQHEFKQYYDAALRAIPELLPQFDGADLEHMLISGEGADAPWSF
jgi:Protein of unknown function (DUF1367)